jgi:hypothetical protein
MRAERDVAEDVGVRMDERGGVNRRQFFFRGAA